MSFRIYSNKVDVENKNVLINFRETEVKIPDNITRIKSIIKNEIVADSSISKNLVDTILIDPTFSKNMMDNLFQDSSIAKNMFNSLKDVFKIDTIQKIHSLDFINNKLKFNTSNTSKFFKHEDGFYKNLIDGSFFLNIFISYIFTDPIPSRLYLNIMKISVGETVCLLKSLEGVATGTFNNITKQVPITVNKNDIIYISIDIYTQENKEICINTNSSITFILQ